MIIFRNPGIFDIRGLMTFGLSSKEGQDKIGRFGTGVKYASAVVARHGGSITIITDGQTWAIGTQRDNFRGRDVDQMTCNGNPLPFTADLGRDWEPWMAFREFYANALDEGGSVYRAESPPKAIEGETMICVDLHHFESIFFLMEEYFITADDKPICTSPTLEVFNGRSIFVFYNGVAVMKLKEPAAFRYNIRGSLDLTEDRTAKYDWQVRNIISRAVTQSEFEPLLTAALDSRNPFETTLDFSSYTPTAAFIRTATQLGSNAHPTALALVRAALPADPDYYTVYSAEEPGAAALATAIKRLRQCDCDVSKLKLFLAKGVNFYRDYTIQNGVIYLNENIFDKPDRMTLAIFQAYDETIEHNWAYKRLLSQSENN